MIDQQSFQQRKNKVNLSDYNFEQDLLMRLSLDGLSSQDIEVLEEILFNGLQFDVEEIQDNLDLDHTTVMDSLTKLLSTQLFTLSDNEVSVNKEKRKPFESHLQRFDEDFSPSLDFVHSLLKNVPIHILPHWYQVPKSSDNIFDSLIERYFHTPQMFERYLMELDLEDEILQGIIEDVFASDDLKVAATQLMAKYQVTPVQFEQYMLTLEYSFVLFSKFEKIDDQYVQMILPFHEWREYLLFVRKTEPSIIEGDQKIEEYRSDEYAFSQDMATILSVICDTPLKVSLSKEKQWTLLKKDIRVIIESIDGFDPTSQEDESFMNAYFSKVISKLISLKLAKVDAGFLLPCESAVEWIRLQPEKRAFSTYKHPLNQINDPTFSAKLNNDRNIREIEKSIAKVAHSGWVYFDEFMEGLMVPLSEGSRVELKRSGKNWKYQTPKYSDEEKSFIEMTILEWLFESGIIRTGVHDGKICFTVTNLGKSLFGG